jgi:hypothetical protein
LEPAPRRRGGRRPRQTMDRPQAAPHVPPGRRPQDRHVPDPRQASSG